MNAPIPNPHIPATRQPIFNLPAVVSGLIALLLAIHAGRVFLLSRDAGLQVILDFAFIPIRETHPEVYSDLAAVGQGARVWTFLTYAFLHADWGHVLINSVWLAAFGSPVARRFGVVRFLAYAAVGAIAGVAVHLAIYPSSVAPVVGASAAISALMAGAARFIFQPQGPMWSLGGFDAYRQPAAPLRVLVRDGRVMMFLGVWFVVNIIFGLTGGAGLASGAVAWAAHVGGFLAGLLLFRLFDPVPRAP
ncbi:MAG TPA: rhomboid family intramembrane serine protease [Bauldia sp.]|nr:rhomboid family intramembrane serine protease [Bauldia sp.]